MEEIEIRGFIENKASFKNFLKALAKKFGDPRMQKRLSFVTGDYTTRSLETRLRITDGKINLAQKIGDVGAITRQEHEITLTMTAEEIAILAHMFHEQAKLFQDHYSVILQHENYLFYDSGKEIKLYRQFGNNEFFAFEIEASDLEEDGLVAYGNKLGLNFTGAYDTDEIIRDRNTRINIPFSTLTPEKRIQIIRSYLS